MASSGPETGVPEQLANVTPDITGSTAQSRLIAGALEGSIKDAIRDQRHSDFVFIVSTFAAGFILLAGMLIFGYFKLDGKIDAVSDKVITKVDALTLSSTRVDTKLEDLLQRIPPAVTPPKGK